MVDYLYHYTDLKVLKLILSNKTFRLSSLANMDDLEEGETQDFEKVGRHIYISSWTSIAEESLLLWQYSKTNEGIRIRLKPDIFKEKIMNGHLNLHGKQVGVQNAKVNPDLLNLMAQRNILFNPFYPELFRVTYTDLERLLKPSVYKADSTNTQLITQDVGMFKRVEWKDQNEWRYRVRSYPISIAESEPNQSHDKLMNKIRTRSDIGYIDLQLKDSVFEDLEVMCSPYMSDEGKQEVKDLLNNYASNAVIKYSNLKIRQR